MDRTITIVSLVTDNVLKDREVVFCATQPNPMTRTITLLLALGASISTFAQTTVVHRLHAERPVDTRALKMAAAAVRELDQQAIISFDADVLKIRIQGTIAEADLLFAVNGDTETLFVMEAVTDRTTSEPSGEFPVRVDSGDPVADDARYAAAKDAWIQANLERYRSMAADPRIGAGGTSVLQQPR